MHIVPHEQQKVLLTMVLLSLFKERSRTLLAPSNKAILGELIRANIKLINHNTFVGAMWSLFSPVIIFIFMYTIFHDIFGDVIPHYPFYLFIGITCVNFFISLTSYSLYALRNNKDVVVNSMTLRETVIIANAVPHIYKFLLEMLVCIVISLCMRLLTITTLVLLMPLLMSFIMMTMGIGLLLTIGFSFTRDVQHIWSLAARLLFFLTPVFYSLDDVGPTIARVQYILNPITPYICAIRNTFLGAAASWWPVYLHCLAQGTVILGAVYVVFLILEHTIDEYV
ncbi:MAG: ABC transporter permease [Candidatus Omnitrophica bacterium]|nr:ABC transporter permease [Candidatus Omnitrophota bacterium]